jgi:hypothetical protein
MDPRRNRRFSNRRFSLIPGGLLRVIALAAGVAGAGLLGDSRVYAQAAMVWTDPAPLNSNAAADTQSDWHADVATDGAGNWVAVWESGSSLGGTIGTDPDILFVRSTDGGATWTEDAALNTNAATDEGSDFQPQVATGGGTWIATWVSNDSLENTIGTDADILFASSTDGRATWSDPAPVNTNAATSSAHDESPAIGTDGAGTWVVAWHSMTRSTARLAQTATSCSRDRRTMARRGPTRRH